MPDCRFDTYYRYADLVQILRDYASKYPRLIQLESIGKSHEGRDIWVTVLTDRQTGADHSRPALWVDGNIHAAELVGSSACLYLIDWLCRGFESNPEIGRCLQERVFYICPRANPDGAEWALADRPRIIRSSTRPYPYDELPQGGLVMEDMDGDGRLLSMRIPDPNGHWKICPDEPRLLVPREPAETGGQYYRLLPEGRVEDYDGSLIRLQEKRERLDLNRNFPVLWREEHEQAGAGPFPASEPEVRAIVNFITGHPNICGGIAFHSYSGVLLRPYSYQADDTLPAEDLWTYQKIGAKGSALTGYPAVSAHDEFRYHPKQVITGALDDWLYEHRGVFAWTVEIWSPQRQAGIEHYKYIDWYREHPLEDDLKMLRWSDQQLQGKGYVDWYRFDHPQLGEIELGGWDPLFSFWNPPPAQLEQEISRFPEWVMWHNLISPRLVIHRAQAQDLGGGLYRIGLLVQNTGWLPSYVTKKAREKSLTRGVICEIELPAGITLHSGLRRIELAQLEGRAYKPSSPTGWAGQVSDPTDDRVKAEWVVHAPQGGQIKLSARHERAGTATTTLTL
ncbi:MAG: carboxypeptidase [Gammaproteobacteria bacterium RBG_16_57_12]|nr:MAG: carboxypeptidase [Gammaproteobacteria bacterium RBG_16_57_12]